MRHWWLGFGILLTLLSACGPNAGGAASSSPTPTPTAGAALSTTELKYRVIAAVGPLDYCDPDEYPVARVGGAQENAIRLYPTIQASRNTYTTILAHLNLHEPLDDAQKLAVYKEWKQLNVLMLSAAVPFAFAQTFRSGAGSTTETVIGSVNASGGVHIDSRQPGHRNCPICLAAGTTIDAPAGPIPATAVHVGMKVWSTDTKGRRVAVAVVETGKMQAPIGHQVLAVTLADGRSITASPGHPTADGRHLGQLQPGDVLDGARIVAVVATPYSGFTYDLLPGGVTGAYWADGVLLGSTLLR